MDWQKRAARNETEAIERALLKTLQRKYEPQTVIQDAALPADTVGKVGRQADLFS